jgi:large subunit ribosomal protein L7e
VHRRAFIKSDGNRVALCDNITVENALGGKGLLCLNDLVKEIYSVGPHFDDAVNFLTSFQLAAPVGNFEKKILNQNDKVEEKGGFLGLEMDNFLKKIL